MASLAVQKVNSTSRENGNIFNGWSTDESVVASALLDLAGNVNVQCQPTSSCKSDMKSANLNKSENKASVESNKQTRILVDQSKLLIDHQQSPSLPGHRHNLTMLQLTVNNNGQKVLHLPKGFILQPNTISKTSSSSAPIIAVSNIPNVFDASASLMDASKKAANISNGKAFITTSCNSCDATKDCNNNNNNSNNNSTNGLAHRKANVRESLANGNALQLQCNFFSPSSSANQQNNSASANFASLGFKKRGRKRLYEGSTGADGTSSTTNPIKEFRLRQRRRELEENLHLIQLEEKYRKSSNFNVKLEQLYDVNNLNIQFPRIKTNSKRGKAKDDDERINRKKMCARRDSKNYRERAKMKRELITKKIQLLQSLLNNANDNTCTQATIQVIHSSSYLNGCSDSSTCSSSSSGTSSSHNASLQRVTSFSSSSSSSSSSSPSPSSTSSQNLQVLLN